MIKHQDYIRLHMGPLADGIKKHAHQWMKLYGQKLQESASQSLVSLQELLVVSACINILVILQPARFRDLTCSNYLTRDGFKGRPGGRASPCEKSGPCGPPSKVNDAGIGLLLNYVIIASNVYKSVCCVYILCNFTLVLLVSL